MTTAEAEEAAKAPPPRYDLRELAGSFGDLGTFIPLTVAMALSTGLDFGWMLIAAGLMNIATGVLFRLPIPVQPMKAIAAVAIAEGLSGGEVVAAGWVMGIVLTIIAVTGLIPLIDRLIPRPVVRAIQLGIGIKLLINAIQWIEPLPIAAPNSVMTACIIGGLLLLGTVRSWPIVLPAFIAGFLILAVDDPGAYNALSPGAPQLNWITPTIEDIQTGLIYGALPQLPLTLLNSVLAVCALSGDYFPKHRVPPKRMALSVGLMNLLCIGWSGLPMCHGSGGLAAQYRSGARTGGSVIMLGGLKVLLGLCFGISLLPVLSMYPAAALAPLIAFAGFSLAHAGWSATRSLDKVVLLPAAAIIVFTHTLYGVLLGLIIAVFVTKWKLKYRKSVK